MAEDGTDGMPANRSCLSTSLLPRDAGALVNATMGLNGEGRRGVNPRAVRIRRPATLDRGPADGPGSRD